jgi:hypothetical protein
VLDSQTGRPLADASVLLYDPNDSWAGSVTRTDAQGFARLTHPFAASGTTSLVHKTGVLYLARATLAVEAEGYEGIREPLEGCIAAEWDAYGPPLPLVVIHLDKK